MDKSEWRTKGKSLLESYSKEEKGNIEKAVHNQLFQSALWKSAEVVAVTISLTHEWSTHPIIEAAWDQGKKIVVPKCDPELKILTFYDLQSYEQLEVVYYGLQEPSPAKSQAIEKKEIDLLIVPGLIFDRKGYRIGFGGGFYDRFLADFNGVTVSLVSEKQVTEELPSEGFDIPVQHIITEENWLTI
ncbi:5-formyltetrahydrofolate cyclo-ligase [Halobacillus naozhouensis]|uniref:5-formyltetrahydrofolate cyclo-ligase n=1 Tax=Halobacillus naozhouensis TaxID=554880 RepID=A0ABY8ITC0_9BACI|nr:5-formyltetrahydrofolate cyclo-ligase [Halobacillus naozhouensis]WFT73259.1 5-formyltetrahydrofolate cyclo-ligase [Halobacillus naozhouensis]